MPLTPTPAGDQLVGDRRNDTIAGFDGDDTMVGGRGNDLFMEGREVWTAGDLTLPGETTPYLQDGETYEFGSGSDRIFGGDGFDRLSYAGSDTPVQIFLERGLVRQGYDEDRFKQIELLILTDGNDRVSGGRDFVAVSQRGGDDRLWIEEGAGAYSGGAGTDMIRALKAEGLVDIDLLRVTNTIAGGEIQLIGYENIQGAYEARNVLAGTNGENRLEGGFRRDEIEGRGGRDIIYGWGRDDVLDGGTGYDEIYGGRGRDIITDERGDGIYDGDRGMDTITANGGTLVGGGSADTLLLEGRSGVMRGGIGDDLMTWAAGGDTARMIGGAGADTFAFGDGFASGLAVAADFDPAADLLSLPGVSGLADLDATAQIGDDAQLVLNTSATDQLLVILRDTSLTELSDDLFV